MDSGIKILDDILRELDAKIYTLENIGFDGIETVEERLQKIESLKKERRQYNSKKAEVVGTVSIQDNKTLIYIDEDRQSIGVGDRVYNNFDELFQNKKLDYTNTQLKGGLRLLYAIAKNGLSNTMNISELFSYITEFNSVWFNRSISNRGNNKKTITRNDCNSANAILAAGNSPDRLKLSKDKKKVIRS